MHQIRQTRISTDGKRLKNSWSTVLLKVEPGVFAIGGKGLDQPLTGGEMFAMDNPPQNSILMVYRVYITLSLDFRTCGFINVIF